MNVPLVDRPLVSIIVPAYNVAGYIGPALASIQRQTYHNIEVIIVNDGSTDDTSKEVEPFLTDPRFTYLEQENQGVAHARNCGLDAAHGPLVTYLDADDTLAQDKIETQVSLLVTNPEANMTLCNADLEIRPGQWVDFFELGCWGKGDVRDLLLERPVFQASCVMLEKTRIISAGGFDESLRYAEDYDLWLRLAHEGLNVVADARQLVRINYRVGSITHSDNGISRLIDLHRVLVNAAERETEPRRARRFLQRAREPQRAVWIVKARAQIDTRPLAAAGLLLRSWLRFPRRLRPLLLAILVALPLTPTRNTAKRIMDKRWKR